MNTRPRPCREYPWVRATPPGQFPRERYEALEGTTGLLAIRAHVAGDVEEARRLTALGRRIAEEERASRASVPSAPRGYTFPRGR